jgi:hypothetical protein
VTAGARRQGQGLVRTAHAEPGLRSAGEGVDPTAQKLDAETVSRSREIRQAPPPAVAHVVRIDLGDGSAGRLAADGDELAASGG